MNQLNKESKDNQQQQEQNLSCIFCPTLANTGRKSPTDSSTMLSWGQAGPFTSSSPQTHSPGNQPASWLYGLVPPGLFRQRNHTTWVKLSSPCFDLL